MPIFLLVNHCESDHYLAYDPAVSPHYEVFLVYHGYLGVLGIPRISLDTYATNNGPVSAMEWPPSPYIMYIFSPRTGGTWEERSFVRQRASAGIVGNVKPQDHMGFLYHTAYWHEALYIRGGDGFGRLKKGCRMI
jgi:hypothetical protein